MLTFMFLVSTIHASALSCTDIKNNLIKGNENTDVLRLQNFLYEKGFLSALPNGYFGNGTYNAVRKFQKSVGLSQSGGVLALTRVAIKRESCPTQSYATTSETKISKIVTIVATSTTLTTPTTVTPPQTNENYSSSSTIKGIVVTSVSNGFDISTSVRRNHMKLGTITLMTPTFIMLKKLSFVVTASTSTLTNSLSNFTITDTVSGKITNTGTSSEPVDFKNQIASTSALFTFFDEPLVPNQLRTYELYADIENMRTSSRGVVEINGLFSVNGYTENSQTVITVPKFLVTISY